MSMALVIAAAARTQRQSACCRVAPLFPGTLPSPLRRPRCWHLWGCFLDPTPEPPTCARNAQMAAAVPSRRAVRWTAAIFASMPPPLLLVLAALRVARTIKDLYVPLWHRFRDVRARACARAAYTANRPRAGGARYVRASGGSHRRRNGISRACQSERCVGDAVAEGEHRHPRVVSVSAPWGLRK